jgi:hypothetical protein
MQLIVAASFSKETMEVAVAEIGGQVRVLSLRGWVCTRTHRLQADRPLCVNLGYNLCFSYENRACYLIDLASSNEHEF